MESKETRKNISMPSHIVNAIGGIAKKNGVKQYRLMSAISSMVLDDKDLLNRAVELSKDIDLSPSLSKKINNLTPEQQAKLEAMIANGEV